MSLFAHIQVRHSDHQTLLWNPYTGRGMQMMTDTYEKETWHPAIQARTTQVYLHNQEAPIENLILHRSRWSIVRGHTLIHPHPQTRTSGGYAYQEIVLEHHLRDIWLLIDGKRSIGAIAQMMNIDALSVHQMCLPLFSYTVQALQLRKESLPPNHRALLQLFSPPRPQNIRKEHMYDTYGGTTLETFHSDEITRAHQHFDRVEITLAHALEPPHPSLKNLPFGASLAIALQKILKKEDHTILELGGCTGALAKSWLTQHQPQRYIRMDASPTLLEAQAKCVPHTEGILAHAPNIPLPKESVDLFLSNEVIADLSTSSVHDPQSTLWLQRHPISLEPEQEWINLGAWKLLASIWDILRPNGMAYLSEFGDICEIPTEAAHLNHPEVSIHFGQLEAVAQQLGFETLLLPLPQLLDMDLRQSWLSKHSFCALRTQKYRGTLLEARAWHPTSLISPDIHGIEWVPMTEPGPAPLPSRIWALILWKPS